MRCCGCSGAQLDDLERRLRLQTSGREPDSGIPPSGHSRDHRSSRMNQNGAPALALGSRTLRQRAFNVAWVSAYLSSVGLLLLVTRRIRFDWRVALDAIARKLLRRGPYPVAAAQHETNACVDLALEAATLPSSGLGSGDVAATDLQPWVSVFACPTCHGALSFGMKSLGCGEGHVFPVVRGIPRFVDADAYARSFSLEWNTHRTTQLDSRHGADISERTLRAKTGLEASDVAGRLVLDAGVGSGRFAEVLSRWGGRVVGVDLSLAVEAARENLSAAGQVCIAQADIRTLPFAPQTFDLIVSIGVLHHTPDTRRSFEALAPLLKPGGTIAIWVYPDEPPYVVRQRWIRYTSKIPPHAFYDWCRWFIPWTQRANARPRILQEVFPYSRQGLGVEWDVLDTFDGYSPRFHGIHGPAEVKTWFEVAGLVNVREPGPLHTSMRGEAPAATSGVREVECA